MLNQLLSIANAHEYSWNVPATRSQVLKVILLMDSLSRDERLLLLSSWFGRTLTSSKQLTKAEASALIELGADRPDYFAQFIEESQLEIYTY